MQSEEKAKTRAKLSEEDIELTLQCPAVFANKFVVSVGAAVRVTFLEQRGVDTPLHPRSSVVMHHQDAIKLYKLLQDLLRETEEQLSKIAGTQEGSPKNG